METIDPATGRQLPADAIQRVLFIAPAVHVYNIPPLASTKGYTAATWTEDPKRHIFTARLRAIETAIPQPAGAEDQVKTDVVLEDPATGQLFAAAPYTSPAVVEPALDSSRFFALRVQDDSGRKAVLGIGFEERSESFDFGVALQEARRALGLEQAPRPGGGPPAAATEVKRDWSLKDGQTITVNLSGTKFAGRARSSQQDEPSAPLSSFSLAPPPSAAASSSASAGGFSLPPPPPASGSRSHTRTSSSAGQKKTAADLGFDDGQFGEFA